MYPARRKLFEPRKTARRFADSGFAVVCVDALSDIADLSSELSETILFEDMERTDQLFNKLRAGVRDALTIR